MLIGLHFLPMMDCNMFLDVVWTLKSGKMKVLTFFTCTAVASYSKTYFKRSNPFLCLGISNENFLS